MILLSIETTGPISSVAVNNNGQITEIKNEDSYSHLKQLMPMVERILSETDTKPEDLDAIAVSQGPGSFTGIRIGMVSAKGLAQVWNKPIIEVPTLATFAFRDYDWEDQSKTYLYCPVLDAKMHQVYAAAYEKGNKNAVVPGNAYDINDYLQLVKSNCAQKDYQVVFFGDGAAVYKEQIENSGLEFSFAPEKDDCQTAFGAAVLGTQLFDEENLKTCFDAQPEYFRLPEAERKFKTKSLNLRKAEKEDLAKISEIEKLSFGIDAWSENMLLDAVLASKDEKGPVRFVVAADTSSVAYIIYAFLPGRSEIPGEIQSIATLPERRRQGIARRLMLEAIKDAKENGCSLMQLEVRASNTPAICLYESIGFKKTGLRAKYYADGEDAILMDKEL